MTGPVTVFCARCGGIAAEFSLVSPAPEGGAVQNGLQRAGFMGQVTRYGEVSELRRMLERIQIADYTAMHGADADFVAFHCWKCARSYCERCWRIGPPEFDEGFYDCTSAICPEGHEQIVDD